MNPTSGVLRNTLIHLIATFPPNYPKQPPHIRVCSYFPHPNVFQSSFWHFNKHGQWVRNPDRHHSYICLDMLRRKGNRHKIIKNKGGNRLVEYYAGIDEYNTDMDRQVIED